MASALIARTDYTVRKTGTNLLKNLHTVRKSFPDFERNTRENIWKRQEVVFDNKGMQPLKFVQPWSAQRSLSQVGSHRKSQRRCNRFKNRSTGRPGQGYQWKGDYKIVKTNKRYGLYPIGKRSGHSGNENRVKSRNPPDFQRFYWWRLMIIKII